MTILGIFFCIAGALAWFVGLVMFLAVAYKRGMFWLIGSLLFPIVALLFLVLNVRAVARPLAVATTAGAVLAALGRWMAA